MLLSEIQTELKRLQIHPVNLHVSEGEKDQVLLGGSLLPYWAVPKIIESEWLLARLTDLPTAAGPQATIAGGAVRHLGVDGAPLEAVAALHPGALRRL